MVWAPRRGRLSSLSPWRWTVCAVSLTLYRQDIKCNLLAVKNLLSTWCFCVGPKCCSQYGPLAFPSGVCCTKDGLRKKEQVRSDLIWPTWPDVCWGRWRRWSSAKRDVSSVISLRFTALPTTQQLMTNARTEQVGAANFYLNKRRLILNKHKAATDTQTKLCLGRWDRST